MCGIAGIVQFVPEQNRDELSVCLKNMADKIAHRGPDGEGVWVKDDASVGFSHRRLSIIDLSSAGAQPMWSNDQRFCITFNGEIYNYLEIKQDLLKKGIQFTTETDTEVLIEAYRVYGEDMLELLDGMFAFAIYDSSTKETFVARDPFGEKPFYYTINQKLFSFASELDALRVVPGFDDTVVPEELAKYLCLQYFDGESTIFRGAKKLKPGHYARITSPGVIKIRRYFQFSPKPESRIRSLDDWSDELEALLVTSLERRLRADVPVGAFLSGGVDSSTVVALATKKLGVPIKTFTIGFEGFGDSEHLQAAEIAAHLGVENSCKMIDKETLARYGMLGNEVDEPNGDTSLFPTYLLSQFARSQVKVALSGDGSDELFGGYGRYMQTLAEEDLIADGDKFAGRRYYNQRILVHNEAQAIRFTNIYGSSLYDHLGILRAEIDNKNGGLLERLRETDIQHYLPGAVLAKVDRMSMRHGLEVRTPFLNIPMARFAERLPPDMLVQGDSGKQVLKNLASRYMPRSWMERQKRGFGLPSYQWSGNALIDKAKQQFIDEPDKNCWWINSSEISSWLSEIDEMGGNEDYKLWALLHAHDFMLKKGGLPPSGIDVEMFSFLNEKLKGIRGLTVCLAYRGIDDWRSLLPGVDEMIVLFARGESDSKIVDWLKSPSSALDMVMKNRTKNIDNIILLGKGLFNETLSAALTKKGISRVLFYANREWQECHLQRKLTSAFIPEPALLFNSVDGVPYNFKRDKIVTDFIDQLKATVGMRVRGSSTSSYFSQHYSLVRTQTPQRAIQLFSELTFLAKTIMWEKYALKEIVNHFGSSAKNIDGNEAVPVKPRTRIALVISDLSSGGAERQLCNLAIGIKKKGLDVLVITLCKLQANGAHFKYLLDENKISIVNAVDSIELSTDIVCKLQADPDALRLLNKLPVSIRKSILQVYAHLVNWDAQAMISYLDQPNIIGGVAALLSRTDIIINSFRNHNPENFDFYQSWYKQYYKMLVKSDRVNWTGNSNSGNASYERWANIDSANIKLIRNGLNFKKDLAFKDDVSHLRDQYGLNGHKVICGVFRLSREKSPMLFLDVVAEVIGKMPGVKAIILGSGPYAMDLQEEVVHKNLQDHVLILGRKKNVLAHVALSDVILQTSQVEGTPNSLIEAQYLRKPVVTTNAGGSAEAVDDGESGYVLPLNEREPLVDAVLKILSDDEVALQMGEYGHGFVKERFSVTRMVDEYIDIIQKGTSPNLAEVKV